MLIPRYPANCGDKHKKQEDNPFIVWTSESREGTEVSAPS